MRLKKEEFSFKDMLRQIDTMIQAQCRNKGLTYHCRIIGRLNDDYIGDDMRLKQILINILSNAIKFTNAPGTVTMTIEQIAEFEDNATLQFIITDTGIGMEQSYLPKIFDTFSQENRNHHNKPGSTGLGMAITKNIVEMMNGNITVKSEKDKGSEFTVAVTLRKTEKHEVYSTVFDPKQIRALVIDDDEIACQHARLVLEEVGISADTSPNGQEALKMIELRHAKQEPYHLILIDWKMPDHDGVEITQQIREHYDDKATIIMLTAYNWDEIIESALAAGVDSFMAKPLFASTVLNEFEQVMTRRERRKQSSVPVDLAGKRILLAEDVGINAEIIKEIFNMRHIQTDHAENGQFALDMFQASPIGYYDAILMDVRMPVMNGLQASTAIRKLNRSDAGTIPIIAMTANAFDEDVQNSLQAGMNAHLSKPVEMDRLYATLENLIGKTKHSERS